MDGKVSEIKGKEKTKKRWEKSSRIGDDESRVTVREIENGYLITKYRSWKDDEGWHSDEDEVFSKSNPLEKDEEASDKPSIKDLYTSIFGEGQSLTD